MVAVLPLFTFVKLGLLCYFFQAVKKDAWTKVAVHHLTKACIDFGSLAAVEMDERPV